MKVIPFCLCDYGYGGDQCDVDLLNNPDNSLISSILTISEKYNVPGMFDLQDQIDVQTKKIMKSVDENKQKILTEMRSGQHKNKNTVLAAQSLILNQMKLETNTVLGEFTNLKTFLEAALEKERYDRMMSSEQSTSQIVHSIVEVAQQITDSLVNLDRKTVENRYFDELILHIPVFQRLFEYAYPCNISELTRETFTFSEDSCASSEHMKETFSEYLRQNKHYFYVAREALTHAVVGRPDSYLRSHMKEYMTSGCTKEYNEQVRSIWKMLLDLHSSTYIMEYWDMFYRRDRASLNDNYDNIKSIDEEIKNLDEQLKIEADLLRKEHDAACPSFNNSKIVGGGCLNGSVFRGQTVKTIKCIDESMNLILGSSGAVAEEIVCQNDGEWNVNITDLKCVQSCAYDGTKFAIGESRKLPLPRSGFQWVNSDNEVVTQSGCVFNTTISNNTAGSWSHYEEEDINECFSRKDVCGSHSIACVNTNGSYACYCEPGFFFNPGSGCEDINECTAGGRGAISCMVSQQLGVCNNTEGSFECICLVGAYKSSNSSEDEECSPCPCHEDGVTSSFCDVKTGECFCKDRVKEGDCSGCKEGFTNFPYCNKCSAGYFDFPRCNKCQCNTNGTTDEICNPKTGVCLCTFVTHGTQCDKCSAGYFDFPRCDQCECFDDGTTNEVCEPQTGECLCKDRVKEGDCSGCKEGFTNFPY